MKYLIWIVILLTAGCAAHETTQFEVTANADVEESVADCQRSLADIAMAEATVIRAVPSNKRDTVTLIYLMQKNNVDLVAAATGHSANPCKQTNMFDAQIAEVKAKNDALKSTSGNVLNLGQWIVGGTTIAALADKIGGDSISNYSATDNATMTVDSNKSGTDNNIVSGGDTTVTGGQIGDTDNCADGGCDGDEGTDGGEGTDGDAGTEGEPNVELDQCLASPPGGIIMGTPLWSASPACSCSSHFAGNC
jgi:hypothetical protein